MREFPLLSGLNTGFGGTKPGNYGFEMSRKLRVKQHIVSRGLTSSHSRLTSQQTTSTTPLGSAVLTPTILFFISHMSSQRVAATGYSYSPWNWIHFPQEANVERRIGPPLNCRLTMFAFVICVQQTISIPTGPSAPASDLNRRADHTQ